MNTTYKILPVIAIATVIGVAAYLMHQHTPTEEPVTPTAESRHPRPRPEPIAPQPGLEAMRMERDALAASLEKVEADRDAAMHSAQLYKELAQLPLKDALKQRYPTRRHVTAAMGSLVGRMVTMQAEVDPSKELGDLPPEEARRLMAAANEMMTELLALNIAEKSLQDKTDGENSEDPADHAAVFAYGALELDEQQFHGDTAGFMESSWNQVILSRL